VGKFLNEFGITSALWRFALFPKEGR